MFYFATRQANSTVSINSELGLKQIHFVSFYLNKKRKEETRPSPKMSGRKQNWIRCINQSEKSSRGMENMWYHRQQNAIAPQLKKREENKPIWRKTKLNLNFCHQQNRRSTPLRICEKLKQGLLHVIHISERHQNFKCDFWTWRNQLFVFSDLKCGASLPERKFWCINSTSDLLLSLSSSSALKKRQKDVALTKAQFVLEKFYIWVVEGLSATSFSRMSLEDASSGRERKRIAWRVLGNEQVSVRR